MINLFPRSINDEAQSCDTPSTTQLIGYHFLPNLNMRDITKQEEGDINSLNISKLNFPAAFTIYDALRS